MTRPRQIVVCERSEARARALTGFLERDPGLEVAGSFAELESLSAALTGLTPDLVVLDLATAGDGAVAAVDSLADKEKLPVLLLCGRRGRDDEVVAAALAAGALDAVGDERLGLDDPESVWAVALRSRIRRLANVHLRRGAEPLAPPAQPPWRSPGATYSVLAIGASVGGPPALAQVLGALPADFSLPILVVQHLASGFGEGLASWLDRSVPLPVAFPADGAILRPGVWMAPEGAHLRLESTLRLGLDSEGEHGAHRPSVDALFESVAAAVGPGAAGVVLTGMGRDGADGIAAIRAAGGLTIAQDEESSAVFGMPNAAIEAGAEQVLSLDRLAAKLPTLRAGKVAA